MTAVIEEAEEDVHVSLGLNELPTPPKPVSIGPTWAEVPGWEPGDPRYRYVLPDRTLGWQIQAWVEGVDSNGIYAPANIMSDETDEHGRPLPFRFTSEQLRFVLWMYAVDERGRFIYRDIVLQRLKGWGKDPLAAVIAAVEFVGPCRFAGWADGDYPESGLRDGDPVGKRHPRAWIQIAAVSKDQPLALDTRVRTPQGWTTVGNLSIGDLVFDEFGHAQEVRRETEVFTDLDCYRLTFDDGKTVVASAGHGWTVERKRGKGDYHVTETLTTEQIANGYLDNKGGRRVRIPVAPTESPEVELPVDPYILGLWLGDGNRRNGTFAIDWRQRDELESILTSLLGPKERITFTFAQNNTGMMNIRNASRHAANGPALITRLRDLGVLYNKHIPEDYAFAGTDQRRALLQGLIDSDGCILPDGQVRFTNADRRLIDGTRELVESLGYKAHVRSTGPNAWVVGFRPGVEPVARLSAKAARQKPRVKPQSTYRYVTKVERIESVPVKCIGIDTPSHLFQVEGGVLTHNTKNTMTLFPGLFSPACIAEHNIDIGKEVIYAHHGRCRIEAVTSSPKALEGGRPTLVIKNETHHWLANNNGHEMAEVVDRNAVKAKDAAARTLSITNAYNPGDESVAQQERESWEEEVESGWRVTTMYDSLEAPKSALLRLPRVWIGQHDDGSKMYRDPTEEEVRSYIGAVVSALRGDSVWLDVENIVSAILKPRSKPALMRRFYYNQVVAAEDAWVHGEAVQAAVDPMAAAYRRENNADPTRAGWNLVGPDEPIVMFFDGSKSRDSTGLVGCRLSDGYTFVIGVWQQPKGKRGDAWLAPRGLVDERVREAHKRFKIVAFLADPSHALDDDDDTRYWDDKIDEWHRDFHEQYVYWSVKSGQGQHSVMWDMTSPMHQEAFVKAAERFRGEMERLNDVEEFDPSFKIDGHPAFMRHLRNARAYDHPKGYGVSLHKGSRTSKRKIDLAVCAVGARMLRRLVLNKPKEEEKPERTGYVW